MLASSIDYAGLFPPAALGMAEAVRRYAEYLKGSDAWALGRFVVPASRLEEFEREADELAPRAPAAPWRLSVLLGADPAGDVKTLGAFNCRHARDGAAAFSGDVVEVKADSVAAVQRILAAAPRWAEAYVEVPLEPDPTPLIAAIAKGGARAKVRTGGITPEAFPSGEQLLRFLRACTTADVPFKATAGLHHTLRAEYPLTYAPDSPRGTMFGFLNLFLAAAFLRQGMSDADALQLLEERSPSAFGFAPDKIEWRTHRLDQRAVDAARARGIQSFGSCSFAEPVAGVGRADRRTGGQADG
jgi:hypothetical protein